MDIGLIILLSILVLTSTPLIYYFFKSKKDQKKKVDIFTASRVQKRTNAKMMVFYQRSYDRFSGIPILRNQLSSIRRRLSLINTYDEFTIRKETMRITFWILGFIFIGITLVAFVSWSFIAIMIAIAIAIVANGLLITIFVSRVENRLLNQFADFLEETRHEYQETQRVDDALYNAAQISPHTIKLQTEKIHEVISSEDPEGKLSEYYAVAPNRYLKIFAGVSHMVMEYGDKKTSDGSMYLATITKFVKQIRDDLLRKRLLNYQLQGLTMIALSPILLSFPVRKWSETYFPVTQQFYSSRLGYITLILIFATSVISYVFVRKVGELDEDRNGGSSSKKQWEKKVYSWPWAKWIVDRLVPQRHTRAHYKLSRLLKESNSPLTKEWFYIQRLTVSLASFITVVILCVFLHYNAAHQIITTPTAIQSNILGSLTGDELQQANQLTSFDNAVMKDFMEVKDQSRDSLVQTIKAQTSINMDPAMLDQTVDRILTKMNIIQNEYFKWWELFIAIGVAFIVYYIPMWILQFKRRMRAMEIQNEVDQFHTLISILMQFDRMSVDTVLEWLERFSVIFKTPLRRAVLNYESGAEQALQELREEAPFESFDRVVRRLIRASEKVSVGESFNDLHMQQDYHAKDKEDKLNRMIQQKAVTGKMIGFIPTSLMIFMYLVFPMIYMSYKSLSSIGF
ncbi:hypothetical protein C0Q44_28575 [Paenibacillus sp. PCH8]|uniref:hypothetical protein n=1 Tax=Paenibacillus sp. PCH8 TaxID=2066524 RepID=UPI000CF9CA76|nr:hypothetical protein [Paenibacillus sp. PCH8]PQP80369.1 hypothetical protein C0Q44_28575 [Paenibacillus sp. PCH8]